MDSALVQKGNEMSDLANGSKPQHLNEETLRKVLRITLVVWVMLFLVYLVPVFFANLVPLVFTRLNTNLFVPLLYVNFLYWALIPLGVVTILWTVRALRASSRAVVLCAGAMMIIVALWHIYTNSWWFRIRAAATYSFPLFGLSLPPQAVFLGGLLMTLWPLLLVGGLLLQKERRDGWSWVAGALAFLGWVLALSLYLINVYLVL